MLQLKNIVKSYRCGEEMVPALSGISVTFRDNEFVAILGPSGCGKTTLLNIVGGLDRYDSGDLLINGRSTTEYNSADWDSYRNHSIGFVFQSYNLIPHQTVLSNVELALTLSGVTPEERRRRAVQALEEVGLGNQLKKRPNQMSGGQMQRVAIARALVNNPDILLADEPTGALDSTTSEQIMALLSKVAEHRLVVMVTHNASLAEAYATRTVRMLDGHVTGDTNPFEQPKAEEQAESQKPFKHTRHHSMSLFTALQLSFQNLLTKKARTILTAFAGSIGIIGIALILALSTGVTKYISDVQEKTLASYPLQIDRNPTSISGMISAMMQTRAPQEDGAEAGHDRDAVYLNSITYELMNNMIDSSSTENNLVSFKEWLTREHDPATSSTGLDEAISAIQYSYDLPIDTYVPNADGTYRNASYSALYSNMFSADSASGSLYADMGSQFTSYSVFSEMLPGETRNEVSDVIKNDYDMVYGEWPDAADELVLVLSENNEVSDITLYSLGLISEERMMEVMKNALSGTPIEIKDESWSYADICAAPLRLLQPCDRYTDSDGDGIFTYVEDGSDILSMLVKDGMTLKVVGIVRPSSSSDSPMLNGSLCYTAALTDEMLAHTAASAVYRAQNENPDTDVLTGLPFTVDTDTSLDDAEKRTAFLAYAADLNDEEKTKLYQKILALPDEAELEASLDTYMEPYQTRADMEKLIADSYGQDNGTVLSYLDSYTDDELRDMLRTTFRRMLETQYETAAQATIDKISATPSEDELSVIAQRIRATLQDRTTIVGFILSKWTTDTAMPSNIAIQYLATLPDAQLEEILDDAIRRDATSLYASSLSAAADKSGAYRKCAVAFDTFLAESEDNATVSAWYDAFMPTGASDSTLANNLSKIGSADSNNPSAILLYAKTFAAKEKISDSIDAYNRTAAEEDVIEYTDYVALIMSSVTRVINAISYVLIAFVGISLFVSSIMIGIITYISVLERTKEIGILRAIGASKRDVSRVFNAETLIVGFCAGGIGILATLLMTIPINFIVHKLTNIAEINAYLPPVAAVILIVISMILTLCAGIIPSIYAASKDPVVALRTE